MALRRTMTRDLNLVVVLSAAAQVAAFFKSILIAYFFGVSPELDGYFLAQVVPAVVTGTAIGVLQASFVPTYVRLKTEGRANEASCVAGRLVQIIVVAGGAMAAVIAIFAPQIIQLTAPLAEPSVVAAATYSLRVLSLLLLMNALADFLALLLNAELRFAAAAIAPIGNAAVASAFLAMAPELGLANLVWGTVLGLAVQVAVLAYALARARVAIRLSRKFQIAHLRTIGRLSITALPAVVIANVAANLPSVLAGMLGAGAVSAFSYAWKLNQAATQAAGIAIGTVMLPHFSEMLARRDRAGISTSLARVVPLVFAIGALALIWIWVAGEPFLATAFRRGKFSDDDVQSVHRLWLLLALGLCPYVAGIALAKVIQASGAFAQLAMFGLAGLVVTCLVSSLLVTRLGIAGVAVAITASSWCVFSLCIMDVARRLPTFYADNRDAPLGPRLMVLGVAAAAMALVRLLPDSNDFVPLGAATLFAATGALLLVRTR